LTDPSRISNLNALLLKASRLLKNNLEEPHWTIAQDLIRDEILTELVSITIRSSIRHEHRAHLNQNASMARIDNYIDTHAFGAIELQRLCMGVALSLRTVERVIRNRTGLTALTYFRKRKLAFARQVLLHPNNTTTVTNTALDFGFLHFSRFSAEYRAMYGELPSTTLNRARS
jgi:methylphosphotriester-DNA--protein-cysteine methyltransferase